jgi:peroxiredoxin
MKKVLLLPAMIVMSGVVAFGQLQAPGAADSGPAVGAVAPDFTLPQGISVEGENLSDMVGKKNVLLMFFPAAFTRGCTTEFTEAGIYHDRFVEMNIELIGISRDLFGALGEFKNQTGAKNAFLSDPDMTVIRQYEAEMAGRGIAARHYFLIDEQGKVVWKSTNNSLIPTEALLDQLSEVVG